MRKRVERWAGILLSRTLWGGMTVFAACFVDAGEAVLSDSFKARVNESGVRINGMPLESDGGVRYLASGHFVLGGEGGVVADSRRSGFINIPFKPTDGTISVASRFEVRGADWVGVGFSRSGQKALNGDDSEFWAFINKGGNVTVYQGKRWIGAKQLKDFDPGKPVLLSVSYDFGGKRVRVVANDVVMYDAKAHKEPEGIAYAQIELQNPEAGKTRILELSVKRLSPEASAQSGRVRIDTCKKVSDSDSIQDVLPEIGGGDAVWLGLASGLVDGGSSKTISLLGPPNPENGTRLYMDKAPVRFTWDLGKVCEEMSLIQLAFSGKRAFPLSVRISVSTDGRQFNDLPGARLSRLFDKLEKPETDMHRVSFEFAKGEAAGFRYLRVEFPEKSSAMIEVFEIDAFVKGCAPRKYTAVDSVVSAVNVDGGTVKPLEDQTKSREPAPRAISVSESGMLVCDGLPVLDLSSLMGSKDGVLKVSGGVLSAGFKSQGLGYKVEGRVLDKLLSLDFEVSGLEGGAFKQAALQFREAGVVFDGVTSGTAPSYFGRDIQGNFTFGPDIPYFIFINKEKNMELHFYLPDNYNYKGSAKTFTGNLVEFEFFGSVLNTIEHLDSLGGLHSVKKWLPIEKTLNPGDKLRWRINIAAFPLTPPTLGSRDIESTRAFSPLRGIFTGVGNQTVRGVPQVLHGDKMRFMGFRFPDKKVEKPGNHLEIEPWMNIAELAERFSASGVGLVSRFSDYRDVSHGISHQGDYEACKPGFEDELKASSAHGIRVLSWHSPRGFLQKDWGARKKDPTVGAHPEWFTKHAHWFGAYRTVNAFLEEPNQWTLNKMDKDFRRYPLLGGVCFDTFPLSDPAVDPHGNKTLLANDMEWLSKMCSAIRLYPPEGSRISVINATSPRYDEYMYFDFGGVEHPLRMFLNETIPGRAPFSHPFVPWECYGQLYFWYSVIGHMYYNFCDYNQAVGWVGPLWVGMMPGQMRKDYSVQVAPLWYIMGKGERLYGVELLPGVRQVEARLPDSSYALIVCSMLPVETRSVQLVPGSIPPGCRNTAFSIDTAREHVSGKLEDYETGGARAIRIDRLPPYSMAVFRFK